MKKILWIGFYLLPIIGLTQTIEFIEPRTVQNFEKVDYTPIKTTSHFYLYMDMFNMKSAVSRDMQIDVYNNDFKNTASGKIDEGTLAIDDANIYENVVAMGDQIYLFKYHFVKKETKLALNYYPISDKGERGAGKELVKFTAEKAMNSGNFTIVTSPDNTKLAVIGYLPNQKEMNEKCIIWVFDKDFKELWKKEHEFDAPHAKGSKSEIYVNNDGVVFMEKRVAVKKAIDYHTMFTFISKGSKVIETKLALATDAILSSYKTTFTSEGDLIMAGFYYIDKKVGVNVETPNGPFYVKVSAKDGSIPVQMASNSTKLQNLRTISIHLLKDNSIILTGEQQYEKSTPKNPGSTTMDYDYEYNDRNILTVKLGSDGAMAWENVIERDLKSMNDNGKLNNVFTFVTDKKVILIYRDHLYKHDGEKHTVVGPALANVFANIFTTLDMNGKIASDTFLNDKRMGGKTGEYYLIPASGYKIDDNNLFMLATRNRELVSTKISF